MRLIAFITQRSETMRILKHIGEQTVRDPPLRPNLAPESTQEAWFRDFIPPVEAYISDPEYVN